MNSDPNGPIELYDLANDPSEENNIAELNPDISQKMIDLMQESHSESDIFKFKHEKAESIDE